MAIVIKKKAGAAVTAAPVVDTAGAGHRQAVETERRKRIRLACAALAYEVYDKPIMDDAEFDRLSKEIDPAIETGDAALDQFFKTEFDPSTGSWVHNHPDTDGLHALLKRVWGYKQ